MLLSGPWALQTRAQTHTQFFKSSHPHTLIQIATGIMEQRKLCFLALLRSYMTAVIEQVGCREKGNGPWRWRESQTRAQRWSSAIAACTSQLVPDVDRSSAPIFLLIFPISLLKILLSLCILTTYYIFMLVTLILSDKS